MIVEYLRYRVAEDRQDAFLAAYGEAQGPLGESSHCLGYELARCVEEPACFILRIEWDSPEGHLQGFRRSPEFRRFFAAVRPFVGDIEEMRHYDVTPIRSARGKHQTSPAAE